MKGRERDIRAIIRALERSPGRFREDSANPLVKKLARAAGLRNCGREYRREVVAIALRQHRRNVGHAEFDHETFRFHDSSKRLQPESTT